MLPLFALLPTQIDPLAPLPSAPVVVPLQPALTPRRQPNIAAPVLSPPSSTPILTGQVLEPIAPVIVPRDWRGVFAAIHLGQWASAAAGIATLADDPLKQVARAELYTAKGSPIASLDDLQSLLAVAPELPEAEQIERIAVSRGAIEQLAVPERPIVGLGGAPRRTRARPVVGEPPADQLRTALDPLLKLDSADAAEALMRQSVALLSPEARAEAAQRVAWSYYALGRDTDAIRVAEAGRTGAVGDWGVAASWVSGLASWRQNDCASAGLRFREVATQAREPELAAAGYYWGARAAQSCRQPDQVAPLLRLAARSAEGFYGLLARQTLGMVTRLPSARTAETRSVEDLPNVRRAVALAGIGERSLAEESLRHQARIGRAADQSALIAIAQRLDLAGAQYWLATNGQPGISIEPGLRYPRPRWNPQNGWRVDPALAWGHALQESNFRTSAVSLAGAVGVMQVRPGTAADKARSRGTAFDPSYLTDPTVNLDYGQAFIELLRSNPATRGQLPRVIAAYNAGPVPVDRWNAIPDKGDPLLWIESLPYWETRYYVPAVLRNMWVYQGLSGEEQSTLKAMAQHQWPAFPTR